MANDITNWVKRQTVGDRNAKAVLRELADCANDDGEMWYAIQTIADVLEASYKTVERGLAFLEEEGFIKRTERTKTGGRFTSKRTKILIPENDWKEILRQRQNRNKLSPSDNLTDGESEPSDNLTDGSAPPSGKMTDGDARPSDNLTDGEAETGVSPSDNLTNGQNDRRNISNKDLFTETSLEEVGVLNAQNARARDGESLADFREIFLGGVAAALRVKRLPNRDDWLSPTEWAHSEGFTALHALEVYSLMKRQKWRKSPISPKEWQKNLTNLENLQKEIDEQNGNSHPTEPKNTNDRSGGKSDSETVSQRLRARPPG